MTADTPGAPLDQDVVREHLANRRGRHYWRGLDELAQTPAFREYVEREFPGGASELLDPVSRRTFLKLMGASLALAGISGCAYMPRDNIAPFRDAPEGRTPGVPVFYATATQLNGYGSGVIVRNFEGRPIKIAGNPDHPASLNSNATDIFTQASILTMYDPDRSQAVLTGGQVSGWNDAVNALTAAVNAQAANQGAGVRILTETVTSPTLANQIAELRTVLPQARWYQWEPVNRDAATAGAIQAFGEPVETRYDLTQANVIVSLDDDFLSPGPGFLAYARDFAAGRRVTEDNTEMNRLYVVDATPSLTGANADHRLPLQARLVESFARALAQRFGVGDGPAAGVTFNETQTRFLDAVAADLEANRGTSVVMVGNQQPAAVHALSYALNAALGNVGTTVIHTAPVAARPAIQQEEIAALVNEMRAGLVEVLIIIGGNPVYNAPADLRFAEQMANVPLSVHLSLYVDETSLLSTWHIPAAHYLETWSDIRAYDGTVSIVQPMIEPLYGGKTGHDLLNALLGQSTLTSYDTVRGYWQQQNGGIDFEQFWQISLSRGYIADTTLPAADVQPAANAVPPAQPVDTAGFELVFKPDPTVWDGSFANNGWLQELPKPITKLTWDNAVLVNPSTAVNLLGLAIADPDNLTPEDLEALDRANGQMLQINYRGGTLVAPVWISPGLPRETLTVFVGYGRRAAGQVGTDIGFNAYALRVSDTPWFGSGIEVTPTGTSYQLVTTQNHWVLENRDLIRVGAIEAFRADPKAISKAVYTKKYGSPDSPEYLSLQPNTTARIDWPQAWGMTINLGTCIGCESCVVACQAENNIPIVGKEQVHVNREMHWLRVDRYYAGEDLDNPAIYHQPLACVQCEQAPCEIVCPVNATVHDNEGINNMIYNRCVGTKYCSNNCPYKVRRFNWLQYTDVTTEQYKMMRNPEVSVRNRGVMEKCTYCVHRIKEARITAKKVSAETGEPLQIPDGAIVTACQAACPTDAIVFGDLNDVTAEVAFWQAQPLNYYILAELNTFARTSYIARLQNQNEVLEGEA